MRKHESRSLNAQTSMSRSTASLQRIAQEMRSARVRKELKGQMHHQNDLGSIS